MIGDELLLFLFLLSFPDANMDANVSGWSMVAAVEFVGKPSPTPPVDVVDDVDVDDGNIGPSGLMACA